jgi:hypothetical protein
MKRRGPEIGIHRCKAGAYPIQQDRGVATSMGEIDCRAYRAMSVWAVDAFRSAHQRRTASSTLVI